MRVVLAQIIFVKLQRRSSYYDFRSYGELCNFIHFSLMKTQELDSLSAIHEWEKYMDTKVSAEFPVAPIDEFLVNYEFGKKLLAVPTNEVQPFRSQRCTTESSIVYQ